MPVDRLSRIEIRQGALEVLRAHAREALPIECCGLLIGSPARIEQAARARNARGLPDRYLIDPADHFAAIKAARRLGYRVVGAYHSHPCSAAVPSRTDMAEAVSPEFLCLIVAPDQADDVRGYFLNADGFEQVTLVTIP
jgi:proteasome lid subunit RPN8/RPN11